MGTLHDSPFPVRVKLAGRWVWLHYPPGANRVTTTTDRRVAMSVNDPVFAELAVGLYEESEAVRVEGWQCVPLNPKDDRVIVEGGPGG